MIGGVFAWGTCQTLPEAVASHFDGSGHANGRMGRGAYGVAAVTMVVLAPLIVGLTPHFVFRRRSTRLNVPHAEYWLAPERRAQTLDKLSVYWLWFALLLEALMAYAHWLVIQANHTQPPRLDNAAFGTALAIFFVGMGVWLWRLFACFRKPNTESSRSPA